MATSHLAQGPAGYMGPVNSFAKKCWLVGDWSPVVSIAKATVLDNCCLNGHRAQTALILLMKAVVYGKCDKNEQNL